MLIKYVCLHQEFQACLGHLRSCLEGEREGWGGRASFLAHGYLENYEKEMAEKEPWKRR